MNIQLFSTFWMGIGRCDLKETFNASIGLHNWFNCYIIDIIPWKRILLYHKKRILFEVYVCIDDDFIEQKNFNNVIEAWRIVDLQRWTIQKFWMEVKIEDK